MFRRFREYHMQIGDLSRMRASRRLHRSAVVQAMAIALTIGFILAGWLALSASGQETTAARKTVAAIERQDAAKKTQTDPLPQSVPPRQEAVADPAVSDGGSMASGAPVEAPADTARVPADTGSRSAALPPAGSTGETSAAAPAAPALSDVTGAVNMQASAAAQPEPTDALVDLNTASFEVLNNLPGAGPLGRAIIKGRPYASAEDLVTKKVLRRPIYEKIKDQVTVR